MDGLRVHNTLNLIDSFNHPNGDPRGYVFIGKTTPWDNDRIPPVPQNNVEDIIKTYDEMLSLKRIMPEDAYPLIRRNRWASNIVYDYYRDDITSENPSFSGAKSLKDSFHVVINSQKDIYICLDNNNNSQSLEEPLSRVLDPFYTSDGYQWLLLYSLNTISYTNYTTDNYLPVIPTYEARVEGEINTVIIKSPGTDYTDFPEGVASRVRAYYCKIQGDGEGAVAKVYVDNTVISRVVVVRQGRNYNHAFLDFSKGKVYKSLYDLDNGTNGLDPEGKGNFVSKVIISPASGWRYNLAHQLVSTDVGVFSQLAFNTDDFVSDIDYRQIGILQDPIINLPDDWDTLSAMYSVKAIDTGDGSFRLGEEITQETPDGIAKGTVTYYNPEEEILHYYQNYTTHNVDGVMTEFKGTEYIIGSVSNVRVFPDTSYSGKYDSVTYVEGYAQPEFIRYSGIIIYLSNIQPIRREGNRAEKVVIIINF